MMYLIKNVNDRNMQSVGYITPDHGDMENYVINLMANGDLTIRDILVYTCNDQGYETKYTFGVGLWVMGQNMKLIRTIHVNQNPKYKAVSPPC